VGRRERSYGPIGRVTDPVIDVARPPQGERKSPLKLTDQPLTLRGAALGAVSKGVPATRSTLNSMIFRPAAG
jgi:hypothetical protein